MALTEQLDHKGRKGQPDPQEQTVLMEQPDHKDR